MRIRSFIIAYALVLAILLFADRRPGSNPQDRYSRVVDLTDEHSDEHGAATPAISTQSLAVESAAYRSGSSESASLQSRAFQSESFQSRPFQSKTRIIAPAALIPGTWTAGQIPAERLVAPLIVMDLVMDLSEDSKAASSASQKPHVLRSQISLDDIAAWESLHGMIPQGAVVAIRRVGTDAAPRQSDLPTKLQTALPPLPITREAAMFLIEARSTIGFAVETPVTLDSDRTLAQQLALHGNYVVEGAAPLTALPATGSLVIVAPAKNAPAKNKKAGETPVRVLAMVK
jgi:kynurenine formamidase